MRLILMLNLLIVTSVFGDTTHIFLKEKIDENIFSNPALAIGFARQYYDLGLNQSNIEWQNKAVYSLAVAYDVMGQFDSAIFYYSLSLERGLKQSNLKLQADAYNGLGIVSSAQGDAKKALIYANKSLDIRIREKDSLQIANSLNNMGSYWQSQGDLYLALKYYLDALKIREKLGQEKAKFSSFHNIATILRFRGENDLALEYSLKALQIAKELKETFKIAFSHESLGIVYLNLNKPDSAKTHFQTAADLFIQMGDTLGFTASLIQLGRHHDGVGQYDSAILTFKQVIKIARQKSYPKLLVEGMTALSQVYLVCKDFKNALSILQETQTIAQNHQYAEGLRQAYRNIAATYEQMKMFDKSLQYYKLYQALSDSIYNKEKALEMGKLQGKYEAENLIEHEKLIQKQREEEQKRETQRKNALQYTGIFLFCVVLSFFAVVASRGQFNPRVAEVLIFLAFIVVIEFLILLVEPFMLDFTGGKPVFSLLGNTILAIAVVPLHKYLEKRILLKKI